MAHPIIEYRASALHCIWTLAAFAGITTLDGCAGSDTVADSVRAAGTQQSLPGEQTQDPSLVKVATGFVRGRVKAEIRQFLGIPYAAAPTGHLRWRPPIAAAPWHGVRDASVPRAICPQLVFRTGGVHSVQGDEDCLTLNVTTPNKSQKKLPVMVWIHGGEYTSGSGADTDGSWLVKRADVIVVTLNYRLGALGFLAHPALTAESRDDSGNYGLLDQQAALAWVKANIAQFGGDPSNVTLFGVSAGGNAVWAHIISPKSAGLFHRAIPMSGLWATNWNWMGYDEPAQPFKLTDAQATGTRFADAIGCSGSDRNAAKCLRDALVADLVEVGGGDFGPMLYKWGPTAGGAVLPRQLEAALSIGAFNRVPIINGSTHDEAMPYVMMPFWVYMNNPLTEEVYAETLAMRFGDDAPAVQAEYPVANYGSAAYAYSAVDTDVQNSCYTRTISRLAATYTKLYAYEFNDPNAPYSFFQAIFNGPLPYPPRAYHASDVQYVFPSPDNQDGLSPDQLQLSEQMIEYYTSFAESGTPRGQTAWQSYSQSEDAVQSLAPNAIAPITTFANDHHCAFWARLRGI